MGLWGYGVMGLWGYGAKGLWSYGVMELWCFGAREIIVENLWSYNQTLIHSTASCAS